MYSLTRKEQVSFQTNVMYFGGNLLLVIAKEKYENKLDLELLHNYFHSNIFIEKYL